MSYKLDDSQKKIIIFGAGLGGMAAAIALKRQHNFHNFIIIEKGLEVGGTWRENSYPGCGCDVPSHWYSLSTDWNPNWSAEYAKQPEILEYLKNTAKRNDLYKHIYFGRKFIRGYWDPERQQYFGTIQVLAPPKPGQWLGDVLREEEFSCDIAISAIGGLHVPEFPKIKGFETFKGDMFHPAQWRHDVSLKNKTVGIIGNGCSAAQIVPTISQDPSVKVVNFCRTASWFAPRRQFPFPAFLRWMFAYVPFVAALYRFYQYSSADIKYVVWAKNAAPVRKLAERIYAFYMRRAAPKHLHDKIIPKYDMGCKRVIRDPGYLASLNQPNVLTKWDAIQEVHPWGIELKTGEKIELDVLVPATGFAFSEMAPPLKNAKGVSMQQYFDSLGGPTAYRGTTVPGFPNLFVVLGPNVASGHGSAIFVEEVQVNYAMKCIKPILEGKFTSVEVKEQASTEYNDEIQARIKTTVWDNCLSYYNQQGGKNVAMYPGTLTRFWRETSKPIWKDYIIVPGSNKKTD